MNKMVQIVMITKVCNVTKSVLRVLVTASTKSPTKMLQEKAILILRMLIDKSETCFCL